MAMPERGIQVTSHFVPPNPQSLIPCHLSLISKQPTTNNKQQKQNGIKIFWHFCKGLV